MRRAESALDNAGNFAKLTRSSPEQMTGRSIARVFSVLSIARVYFSVLS
jgi:hypothetical protein